MWDRCCDRIKTWGITPQYNHAPQHNNAPQYKNAPHMYLLYLLSEVYWQLGRECGTVGRILHDNRVVWGAYRDATGTHMNAHANNFVLLSPSAVASSSASLSSSSAATTTAVTAAVSSSSSSSPSFSSSSPSSSSFSPSFLAPLDFDMAYARDNCTFPCPHPSDSDRLLSDTAASNHSNTSSASVLGAGSDSGSGSRDLFTQMSDQEFCELGFNLAMCQSNQASTTTGSNPTTNITSLNFT